MSFWNSTPQLLNILAKLLDDLAHDSKNIKYWIRQGISKSLHQSTKESIDLGESNKSAIRDHISEKNTSFDWIRLRCDRQRTKQVEMANQEIHLEAMGTAADLWPIIYFKQRRQGPSSRQSVKLDHSIDKVLSFVRKLSLQVCLKHWIDNKNILPDELICGCFIVQFQSCLTNMNITITNALVRKIELINYAIHKKVLPKIIPEIQYYQTL